MDDFSKRTEIEASSEARLPAAPKPEIFEFERADWVPFRTVEGLQQKAGVTKARLRRLVIKELVDNALDVARTVKAGRRGICGFYVEDDGPGINGTPAEIARRFSISRPMISSKLWRLPTRGALGNGLRVVVGAVLASSGSLVVITRNKKIILRPEMDGTTTVVDATEVDHPIGTRVEIMLGQGIPVDGNDLVWAREACDMAHETASVYDGKTSPFWYDLAAFHELFLASGSRPVRELIAELEGCSGKAGAIVLSAGLGRTMCADVNRDQAQRLLHAARETAREVTPERLGLVGPAAYPEHYHSTVRGVASIGSSTPTAAVPFVVEAWARKDDDEDDVVLSGMVNRSPIITNLLCFRSSSDKTKLHISGCGLSSCETGIPSKGGYDVRLNVTTPYCPIISDGKSPDLMPFKTAINEVIIKAISRAQRAAPKERRVSQKDAILENLNTAIDKNRGLGGYQFLQRQVYYVLRDAVRETTGRELTDAYFNSVITDYEKEHGEIEGMYREPRGSLLHPHSSDGQIALGTLMVAGYERPAWTYSKLLYIEKEGFTEALKAAKWPERHDCALMSSKGFTTRAARDLVDKLAEHDEPVKVFAVHDADASGTMIYQTFQEATKARGARKVQIVNFGLEPWEALAMGLASEPVDKGNRTKAVADYVERSTVAPPNGFDDWAEWLQTNRVELNAMTMPQFVTWLDGKMAEQGGKLIPPETVLKAELDERIRNKVRDAVKERILREAGFDRQVDAAVYSLTRPTSQELIDGIKRLFEKDQAKSWRDQIEEVAAQATIRVG